jgi:hypothetical protein
MRFRYKYNSTYRDLIKKKYFPNNYITILCSIFGGCWGCDRMVVGLTTICAISPEEIGHQLVGIKY